MRIIQALDALDYGDGVSNDVINKYHLFKEMGYDAEIFSKWANERVDKYRKDISLLNVKADDILLHHFSGKSHILNEILNAKCTKILVYHNITPSYFFQDISNKRSLNEGEEQLKKIADRYDCLIADSEFNAECIRQIGIQKEIEIVPIFIDFNEIDRYKKNDYSQKNKSELTFLFVGRVAPNKKHEDIIDVFDCYYKDISCNSKLIFVGNYADNMNYYNDLKSKISRLNLSESIIFTGKVDTAELYDYYLNADVFICMSEHEGFCIPLLESMYCGLPTIAYNAGAIGSTMGGAGILVNNKSPERIARLIYTLITSYDLRTQIIEKQIKWTKNFSKETIKEKLDLLLKKCVGEKCYE